MTVKITNTMRDGHQSLLATRMRHPFVILSGHTLYARNTLSTRRNLGGAGWWVRSSLAQLTPLGGSSP